ncbi:MAG: DUF1080 domain-containing protein [Verrucomicrobiales bacterium]|nr:DUF1080 domain-containing protein [Verrucomicrobiales bacterium]
MKLQAIFSLFALAFGLTASTANDKSADPKAADGWTSLFDGKSLDGWKANDEDKDGKVFSVSNGELVVKGGRAHLFYMGSDGKASFKNFEFRAKVLTKKNANSGLYFHTEYQATGWPKKGYEAQVNNSFDKDPRKTGSLYAVKDVLEKAAQDDQWFDYLIKVEGKKVAISINGKCLVEYEEKAGDKRAPDMDGRWLKSGTFAIQAHDPGCEVHYKDIAVKPLP